VPIAAWAVAEQEQLYLRGMISDINGLTLLRGERWGALHAPEQLGEALAEALLRRGGDAILRDIYGLTAHSGTGKSE
jgi:hydroxymethylbilane synthase